MIPSNIYQPTEENLARAAEILRSGGIVSFPTETVYGLGADAFNPKAVSSKGARGLMQLMPATASRLGVRNLHDAEENIRGGTKYLRSLLDTFDNDLTLSLAAYNAGENLVQRVGRIPNIAETHAYVRSVQKRYGKNEMSPLPQPEEKRHAPTFRYTDGNGVLHLTNIAPVERPEQEIPSLAMDGQGFR